MRESGKLGDCYICNLVLMINSVCYDCAGDTRKWKIVHAFAEVSALRETQCIMLYALVSLANQVIAIFAG